MLLIFFFLVVTGLRLYKSYKRDPGEHVAAKVTLACVIIYAIIFYASSVAWIGGLLRYSDQFRRTYEVPVGVLSADVVAGAAILHILGGTVLLFSATSMAMRSTKALRWFRVLLFVVAPAEVVSFYRGLESEPTGLPPVISLGFSVIVVSVLTGFLFVIMGRPYMRAFFKGPQPIDLSPLSPSAPEHR